MYLVRTYILLLYVMYVDFTLTTLFFLSEVIQGASFMMRTRTLICVIFCRGIFLHFSSLSCEYGVDFGGEFM